jgi:hypothetical protein
VVEIEDLVVLVVVMIEIWKVEEIQVLVARIALMVVGIWDLVVLVVVGIEVLMVVNLEGLAVVEILIEANLVVFEVLVVLFLFVRFEMYYQLTSEGNKVCIHHDPEHDL